MMMFKHPYWARFTRDEGGAVTVDWIVLTAALVMMGMAAAFMVGASVPDVADTVADTLAETEVVPGG